ncbi:PhoH family protein [Inquilinus limosus]|uniref:PhoH-like protein n=1 Tax=Inquilinus limosus MP06 TaxID=1398085 RepID=A0A0A0DDA5_9PROT|nr:PhoH family protein [Inquilinus limosus]KGM36114.1 hypothetical protein P409_00250 [Inquilinus limosus MP06]
MAARRKRTASPHYDPPTLRPLNASQATCLKTLDTHDQTFIIGPAGTGKTFLIACRAVDMLKTGLVDKIVLTRPNVPAGRSLGFFPGSLEEKMGPWVMEFASIWNGRASAGFTETALKNGTLEIVPFETMRGRSFDDAFIIVDEAQNATLHELMMIVTRFGERSHLVVNGDPAQSDLRDGGGLIDIIAIAMQNRIDVGFVRFTSDDIVRSDRTKQWVKAFEREGAP